MKLKESSKEQHKMKRIETVSVEKATRKDATLRDRPPSTDYGFPTDFIDFNRMIGNPISKITGVRQDMAEFQVRYHLAIQTHHLVQFLKSRKLGATESWIRSTALNCFDRYKGHDVMLIAGNEVRIANEILIRFDELFRDTYHDDGLYAFKMIEPEYIEAGYTWQEAQKKGQIYKYDDLIRKANFGSNPTVELNNSARVMAFAASRQEKAQSFRGTDDVISAFISEAAHTGMKNDQPIMSALEPNLAQRDDADLVLETTGNGRRGFFYNYWVQTMEIISQNLKIPVTNHQGIVDAINKLWEGGREIDFPVDWWPIMYDYHIGIEENILSKKFIDKEKRNPKLDFEQEYGCFDKETEVLTDQGFKLFSELDKTERMASLNTDTLYLEYVKPIGYLKRKSEYLISFKNEWCNLKVTPNHRMLIHKNGGYHKGKKYPQRFGFRDADKCKSHDQFYRTARWVGGSPEYIEIEDIRIPTETYCKMMGYYLSEGSTMNITYDNRNSWRTNIAQYKDNNRILIFEDLSNLPFKVKLNKTVITFREKKACQYLKQFGYSYQKHIPQEIKDLSPEYIRMFLDAFLLGDGTLHTQTINHKEFGKKKFQTQKMYYTSSKKLVDDLSECILKVGKVPSKHLVTKKGTLSSFKNGTYKINHDVFVIHEGTRKHSKLITMEIKKEEYNDDVYCVELPKNNTLYVRRNGQCVWSSNCKFTSTYSQAIKTEDLTFKDTLSAEYVKSIDLLGSDGIDRDYGTVDY